MNITDVIHGEVTIDDPLAEEIISSPDFRRLAGIDQCGYFEPYFPGVSHSRFTHSVGDYLLLKKFGASREEQIAGLLHDLSHSVFSHAIDYIIEKGTQGTQTHQDDIFVDFVSHTQIPRILKKHGLDPAYILNEHNFPLQETQLPDLCADRIDYSLRSAVMFREATVDFVWGILDSLRVIDNRWVLTSVESAKEYIELFKRLNDVYWAGLETAVMFRTTADYARHGLRHGYITELDLYTTDAAVIQKINAHLETDTELKSLWERMNNGSGYHNDPSGTGVLVQTKSRAIDPWVQHEGAIVRYSDIVPAWKEVVIQDLKPRTYHLRFE